MLAARMVLFPSCRWKGGSGFAIRGRRLLFAAAGHHVQWRRQDALRYRSHAGVALDHCISRPSYIYIYIITYVIYFVVDIGIDR